MSSKEQLETVAPAWSSDQAHHHFDRATELDTSSKREKSQTPGYIVRSLVAGGLAGCAVLSLISCRAPSNLQAKTLVAPLDRIKILFQTGNPQFKIYSGSIKGTFRGLVHIWSTSGIWGLYQGNSATLLRVFPYASIKFVAYDQIRDHLIPTQDEEVWYRRLAAGSLAGTYLITNVYI
jgi:solute carrier family 25 (mitochondrial carrier protein), member 16